MKRTLIFAAILLGVSTAVLAGDVYHKGYVTKSGTYVAPHYQTAPDSSKYNNYSTQGNVNPYTGQAGRVNPEPSTPVILQIAAIRLLQIRMTKTRTRISTPGKSVAGIAVSKLFEGD
jgi:opacity protein-like surface antigen